MTAILAGYLHEGDKLHAVYTPYHSDVGQGGATVGYNDCAEIVVQKIAGPMGYYAVAVIRYEGEKNDEVIPLHMAETIILAEREPAA